jgi:hypothetical protein
MKVRPREINIFNMSLIDILCGALGAFCFMMIVSLPYYKPPGSGGLREQQQATDDLFKDIDRLQNGDLSDPNKIEELKKKLQELEAQVKQLQGQVNSYAAENEELKKNNDALQKKNDDLQAANDKKDKTLKQKKPFLVVTSASNFNQDIDLYLRDDMVSDTTGKPANGPLDPVKPRNFSNWASDQMAFVPNHGVTVWVTSDAPADAHFKVYLKLASDANTRVPTLLQTVVFGDFGKTNNFTLPNVTLTPERYWMLVGTVVVDADNKLTFKEATAAEREAEWTELMKNVKTPTPVPSPSVSATVPVFPGDDVRKEMERLRKERASRQPTPGASADQRRDEMERLRRERLQRQSPAPSAIVSPNDQRSIEERRRKAIELRNQQLSPSPTP